MLILFALCQPMERTNDHELHFAAGIAVKEEDTMVDPVVEIDRKLNFREVPKAGS